MTKFSRALFFGLLAVFPLFLNSCGNDEGENPDGEETDLCKNPIFIEVSELLHTYPGESSGSIKISTSGGNGVLIFSIDGVKFSESNVFENLGMGTYTITVKDENECEEFIVQEILEFPEVSYEMEVYPVIETNCLVSGCHLDDPELPKWDNYEIIAENAGRIRFRVTGKTMPPSTSALSLTNEEILLIQNWVDVGAPNN